MRISEQRVGLDLRPRAHVRALLTACIATLVMAGCASAPPRATAPSALWTQRLAALQAISHFELQGRLAASNGQDGFSAGLRWHQQDADARIDLSAPLGFGGAHIEMSGDALHVTTSKGVRLDNEAANDQLRASLGFDAPLQSLRYWLLGASDPSTQGEPTLDAQQRLLRLQQNGWQIDFADYAMVQQQWLPRRLTLTRQMLRLRLVIETWRL